MQAQHLPLESTDRLHLHNKETPSKYESYVDLVPGEWTKIRIEVDGERARLYVHSNEQPTLMVNDVNRAQTRTAAWHCGLNQEPWLTSGI